MTAMERARAIHDKHFLVAAALDDIAQAITEAVGEERNRGFAMRREVLAHLVEVVGRGTEDSLRLSLAVAGLRQAHRAGR